MSACTKQIGAKTPSEAVPVIWDFSSVVSGSITSNVISKATIVGTDPLAASLIIGASVVSGGSVSAVVSGGTDDCSYELICTVTDSAFCTYQLAVRTTTTTAFA